tara:strand:+ start:230 stop:652 length:423 start_codon:yes stop_codon:yes gene_type:complete
MNTGLHESLSLAGSPCVGVCSTSVMPDDDRCKGCGRTVEEIRDWGGLPDVQKKLINVKNWLEGYEIRQKEDKINLMSINSKQKIKDIQGRLITIQSLIEMVGKDMLDEFGKDPSIKDSYQALFNSRESILKSKENFPQES